MRHGSVVLALALVVGACGGRSAINSNDGGADASAIPDGGFQLDAATQDAALQEDAPAPQDVLTPNGDTGAGLIPCGTTSCNAYAGDECCAGFSGAVCVPAGTCQGVPLGCDGPEDCTAAGQPMCCGQFSGTSGDVACAASCSGTSRRLCHFDAECGSTDKCCGSLEYGGMSVKWCEPEANCGTSNPTPGVPCGTGTCEAPNVCCMDLSGGTCGSAAACTSGLPVACDGPEECQQDGGTAVCCGTINFSGGLTGGAECKPSADCANTGLGGILCHADGDCPSATPTCSPIMMTQLKRCQ